jgi:hypothetical protein
LHIGLLPGQVIAGAMYRIVGIPIIALVAFIEAPVIIMIPFYVIDVLRVVPDWVGYLAGAFGAAGMAGFVVAGLVQVTGRYRAWGLIGIMLLSGAMIAVLGWTYNPFLALGVAFASGLCGGYVIVYVTFIVQLHTPSDARGSVFGFWEQRPICSHRSALHLGA